MRRRVLSDEELRHIVALARLGAAEVDVCHSDGDQASHAKQPDIKQPDAEKRETPSAGLISVRASLARGDVYATLAELDRLRAAEGAPVVSIWTLRDYALLIGRGYRTAAAPWRNARGAAHRLDHGRLVLDLAELERRKLGAASRARTLLVAKDARSA